MAHLLELTTIISHSGTLLTLPDICLQLKRIVDAPDSSANDLAGLIVKDPALTARLLKLVNSSLYFFPKQISSLSQAITLVGTKQLYTLALATSAAAIIRTAGGSYIELKTLWKHSVYSALIAQDIAGKTKQSPENLFISGLLSNIGTLAVVKYAPDIAMNAIDPHDTNQLPWQREQEVLGFTMAEASASLLDAWNLPDDIITPIRYGHSPIDSPEDTTPSCILHIATRLASEMLKSEQEYNHNFLNTIDEFSLTTTDLSKEDLDEIMAGTAENGPEMLSIFTL